MSLGGPTMFAGRDMEDVLTQQMLAVGITVSISAGNAGPSGLTTGSPSTGLGSLSAAAASTPQHERIVRDQPSAEKPTVCRLGRGLVFRPSNAIQSAFFSSRGPTADGRVGVQLTTAGDFNFAQGANGGLALVSGTSFSAPTVSGAAALLRRGIPSATATQVRNALIASANPNILGDHSTRFDQGNGYLDVAAALDLLNSGGVRDSLPTNRFSDEVKENLERIGLKVQEIEDERPFHGGSGSLLPGQRREFFFEIGRNVASVQINLNSVTPELAPAQQNSSSATT
jgi:subtilisin family serine protease